MGGFGTTSRELLLRVKAEGVDSLDAITQRLKSVGGASKITKADLDFFEKAVYSSNITVKEFASVLDIAARNESKLAQEVRKAGEEAEKQRQYILKLKDAHDKEAQAINAKSEALKRQTSTQQTSSARGLLQLGSTTGILPGGLSTLPSSAGALSGLGAVGGVAAGLAAVAGAAVAAANSLGQYAREQTNLAQRTGLTTTQTQLFTRAADLAGVNSGALTIAMRTLSKAMSDNSQEGKKAKQALAELGLDAVDSLKPIGDLLPVIFSKLAALPDGAEKDRIAISLLGRSGLELLPLINHFDSFTEAVKRSGVVIDEAGIKKAEEYQREMKALGLQWDALINIFKQAAVGTIKFIIDTGEIGSTRDKLEQLAMHGLNPFEHGKRLLADINQVARGIEKEGPGAVANPVVAGNRKDADKIRLEQREQTITEIDRKFRTPKEALDDRLKELKGSQEAAKNSIRGAAFGKQEDDAKANLENINRQIRAVEQQKEGLKQQKAVSQEILRLREQLLETTAKTFFGEQRITAEYAAQIQKIKDRPENKGRIPAEEGRLLGQVFLNKLKREREDVAVGDTENARRKEDTVLVVEQQKIRSRKAREAKLVQQSFEERGDEVGGANAAFTVRVEAARQEYEYAKKRADVDKANALQEAREHPTDTKVLRRKLGDAENQLTKERGKLEEEIDAAKEQRQIRLNALRAKDRKEAEQQAGDEIQKRRVIQDIQFARNRTIAEGASRLAVLNANPGFELQAELNADQKRIQADRDNSRLAQQRIQEDIAVRSEEQKADPAHQFEIGREIDKLHLESIKEAARIEIDTLRARQDAEEKIASKRKHDEEIFKSTFAGFILAAQSGGGRQFLKGIGTQLEGTIAGNVAGLAFGGINAQRNGIAEKISGTADSPTFLGKILAGTPLGPLTKAPAELQVAAADRTTTAVKHLEAALVAVATGAPLPGGTVGSGSAIGGPVGILGGLIPGLSTFGSDTNGITGSGPLKAIAAIAGVAGGGGGIGGILKSLGGGGGGGFSGGGQPGDLTGIFTGVSNTKSGAESLTGGERLGAAAATAGAIYGAVEGISQISKGGARNTVGGIGKVAGSAAVLDPEPISKAILAGVALTASVVTAFLGDPRQNRANQINKELQRGVFQDRTAENRTQDIFGNYTDYDKYGKARTSNLSAVQQLSEPYITKRNINGVGTYFDIPGQVTSPFTPKLPGATSAPATIIIQAIDGQSVAAWARNNATAANDFVHVALSHGSGPAAQTVREAVGL